MISPHSAGQPQSNANANVYIIPDRTASAMEAYGEVQIGLSLGWKGLYSSHKAWWHRFYPASFVTFTDSKLESFYWTQLYKLGSATRGDKPGPSYGVYDHTGPWFMPSDTCCPLFNWYA